MAAVAFYREHPLHALQGPLLGCFLRQRAIARSRGIPFLLTFEEWLDVWRRSGRLDQRGCRADQYVMARHGDRGPYAVGNVKIVLHEENAREGQVGASASTRRKLHDAHSGSNNPFFGKTLSVDHRAKISRSLRGRTVSEEQRARAAEGVRAWWARRRMQDPQS